jgi:cytochrome c oxidase subunit 3
VAIAEETQARAGGWARLWDGGVHPYGISHKKFGMWLFLVSDSLTFAALIFGYAYLRHASHDWPRPFEFFPSVVVSTVMTFFLLTSSLTMVLAVHHSQHGDPKKVVRWLLATMACGTAFIVLHANEWRGLIHEGVTVGANPWGSPMFGSSFFTLTGLHMFHVFSGVCYLGYVARNHAAGKGEPDSVEVCGLYWHFVDLVWMFIFPMVYLMSVNMGAHPAGH